MLAKRDMGIEPQVRWLDCTAVNDDLKTIEGNEGWARCKVRAFDTRGFLGGGLVNDSAWLVHSFVCPEDVRQREFNCQHEGYVDSHLVSVIVLERHLG